ncbi:MAG: pyridoxamine 5'-phosphate oxidase family protein [Acidobacteriota bacterium]
MPTIEGEIRMVIDRSEWVAIATTGSDGPHLAATWGDYIRALGLADDVILIPAGGLQITEANLAADPRVELLFASREVKGSRGGGQGCRLRGRGEFQASGPEADAVKARFPWARGAIVIHVEHAVTQL